ncbi:MAG: hypothetical protein HOO00_08970 [Rhodospirillaceae bacterium]|jgi:hypothetical protein|nr:hypothetical protein [Rhodospirillaceae bacterium]MBT5374082.1 hypothetical protein [Rhodospirillaceae bacterium]MBT5658886.1 hypothetical protein [Rhodospirillaceae bacterium]
MSKNLNKIAAIAIPAIMAVAVAQPAEAKILVIGDGGWEVSFDGSVNGFYTMTSKEELPGAVAGTATTGGGTYRGGLTLSGNGNGDDDSRVQSGLLPTFFGVNINAPTTNGLDMGVRFSIDPTIANGHAKNGRVDIDLRENFFTVGGSFGTVQVGRSLSHFGAGAIVSDMTLFGVGAPSSGNGTGLGRIGYGYQYANFNANIRYTTPDLNGFKISGGIYDPSTVLAEATGYNAAETESPRFEGAANYAGDFNGVSVSAWVDGMIQEAQFANAAATRLGTVSAANAAALVNGGTTATAAANNGTGVTGWGFGGGAVLGYAGFTFTGYGYTGEGMGLGLSYNTFGANSGKAATDVLGNERDGNGWYAQGTYAFGQGTSVGVSYGLSSQDETSVDKLIRNNTTAATANSGNIYTEEQSMIDAMIWHDINKNLRIVGEYSHMEAEFFDGADQDADAVSIGGFFFW